VPRQRGEGAVHPLTFRQNTLSSAPAMHPEVKKHASSVLRRLKQAIPDPKCELDHKSPWQLLIATILSAQSTDKKVNEVTPVLFARWPTPADLASAPPEEVEVVIKQTGFFRNKTKSIIAASRDVHERFDDEVPRTMDEITTLQGVARKTANVVLGTAYRVTTGVVVDTHVDRVSHRLELTENDDREKIEEDLCASFPRKEWIDLGHRLVLHGRYICQAKKPRCEDCPLNEICSSAKTEPVGTVAERSELERKTIEARGAVEE
jgi:endonuclease III